MIFLVFSIVTFSKICRFLEKREVFFYFFFKFTIILRVDQSGLIDKYHINETHKTFKSIIMKLGADLGGGGADAFCFRGFDLLPTQKVLALVVFKKSIFAHPTLKFFCRRL